VLVLEDHVETQLVYAEFLKGTEFQPLPVRTVWEAQRALQQVRPRAIILDILLHGQDAWAFLTALKEDEATRDIPLLVVTAVEDQRKALALGADAFCLKPVERAWLLETLTRLTGAAPAQTLLVIDDDVVWHYLLTQWLHGTPYAVTTATSGPEGLRRARQEHPQVIVLDLVMPEMSGLTVLEQLHADPVTCDIPVIIHTAKVLDLEERQQLASRAVAILAKGTASRQEVMAAIQQARSRTATFTC
jgi:CheY-like chemotaxis protein